MIVLILFALPALLYVAVWLAAWRSGVAAASDRARAAVGPSGGAPAASGQSPLERWVLPLAVLLHGLSLFWPWAGGEQFRFGFAKALSATMWLGLALLWFEGLRMRVDALRVLILPLAIVSLLLPLAYPGADFAGVHLPLFLPHLVVGTLAYGVLLLAALHALLMIIVQRDLNRVGSRPPTAVARWIDGLPPLMALERILFRLIAIGFVLLLLTTASGLLFSEQVFGTPLRLEHKSVFSLIALAFFGILLLGRRTRGWRGRIAMRFTLGGFALLMMGYVGSRFVLEVLLRRL